MFKSLLCAATILSLASPLAAQNLVVNPGFETGDLTGWSRSGRNDFSAASLMFPHTGTWSYDFGPIGYDDELFQSVTTDPGATYTFSFWFLKRGSLEPNSLAVSWDGDLLLFADFASQQAVGSYTPFSFSVKAVDDATEIRFTAQHAHYYWNLDDISVVQTSPPAEVSEPTTVSLVAMGLLGLLAVRRRRRPLR